MTRLSLVSSPSHVTHPGIMTIESMMLNPEIDSLMHEGCPRQYAGRAWCSAMVNTSLSVSSRQ